MLKNPNIATYQLIADILNFDNDCDVLKKQLQTSKINWENLVKVASKHLVLTAVYCRLKDKDLLNYLPCDLNEYLKELTSINRNRNKKLIIEAQKLTKLLESHNIEYLFVKGMALLLGGYYKDFGERMIGDFDILIPDKDITIAFNLIKKEGYDKLIKFNYDVLNFRHLPRQVNENKLAAIELHGHVLNPSQRNLIPINEVFENKEKVEGYSIASKNHLNLINVLTSQLNDKNHYYNTVNFKNSYDSLVLGLQPDMFLNSKYFSHYLCLNSVWFKQFKSTNPSLINKIKKKSYIKKIKYKNLAWLISSVKYICFYVLERLKLVVLNKSYRNYLIKSLFLRKT
ncbi:nucleotidyltransferase family protein [Psychroserpens luteus]|uniref:Nucleotidyltransferase family protein n=1 Tax=Psychroserpens luteus TaxID=1434066 RepID=A0ABW5ZWR9_9FLAO|nr:nucleotidyltransferase family protein [Psychroserpens luteus]